ncbi:hypothetical protein JTB14_032090 [Gonioctena quinquepunctata]|nr:hypothetical protein JTB14_032090 [Gonioctena quinquepunctata]
MTITNDDFKSVRHLSVNEGRRLDQRKCSSKKNHLSDIQSAVDLQKPVYACKKNLINEKLNQIYNEETDNPHTSIEITIKDLKFSKSGTVSDKYNRKYRWYFVCVSQSGTTIIARHTHDFEIDVSLYALVLKNNIKKKNKNCLKMTTSQLEDYGSDTFLLHPVWGKTQMRTCQITQCAQNVLALSKVPAEASISNAFTADVETSLKINITMKGFLTIVLWNRRWCVLEGSRINYWNHPNEELSMAPLGQLDLLKTHTHRVGVVDKEFCPRPRTSSFEVRVEGPGPAIREYFLSADSLSEFEEWSRQLNLVQGYLRKWRNSILINSIQFILA